jgi:hypothetical protein
MGAPRRSTSTHNLVYEFVAAHPDCTAIDIADALFSGDARKVYSCTTAMRRQGLLTSIAHEKRRSVTRYTVIRPLADAVREFLQSPGSDTDKQVLADALAVHDAAIRCDDGRAKPTETP